MMTWRRAIPAVVGLAVLVALVGNMSALGELFDDDTAGLTQQVEETVRSSYEKSLRRDLRENGSRGRADVISADCVVREKQDDGTCIVQVDGDVRGQSRLDVTIGDDRVIWTVEDQNLREAPA